MPSLILTHKMEQFYNFNELTNYPVIIAQLNIYHFAAVAFPPASHFTGLN